MMELIFTSKLQASFPTLFSVLKQVPLKLCIAVVVILLAVENICILFLHHKSLFL